MKSLSDIVGIFKESHLNHLNHPEENIFLLHGFNFTYEVLLNLHKKLKYNDDKNLIVLDLSLKIDGSPSIVFGYHPKTKRFFVGTKSVFNQKPKINYTIEDIVNNHSHSPGLVEKLKDALIYLPSIIMNKHGVYQGDIIFSENDKIQSADIISFTPNTITYSIDKKSKHYDAVGEAKFGIAIHTSYEGIPYSDDMLEGMKPNFDKNSEFFYDHLDVHQAEINIDLTNINYDNNAGVLTKLMNSKEIYNDFSASDLEAINHHALMLKTYFNYNIRNNKEYTDINDYYLYCKNKLQADVVKLKSDKGREKRTAIKNNFLLHIINNMDALEKSISIYHQIQYVKNALVHALDAIEHEYVHYINNNITGPEGYIAVLYGIPTKLVNRQEFSKLNFQNSINR